MNKILLQGSVTLAQTFVDNTKRDRDWIKIGENIIRYIYKWFGGENKNEVEYAVSDFIQHNEDCRLECYCCGACDNFEDLPENEPNVNDEYIKHIINLLWEFDNAWENDSDKIELADLFDNRED